MNNEIKLKKNCYKVLGVDVSATQKEIEVAYKELAKKLHPDKAATIIRELFPKLTGSEFAKRVKVEESELKELFTEVNESHAILSDPEKRKQYDLYGFVQPEKPDPKVIAIREFRNLLFKAISETSDPKTKNIVRAIEINLNAAKNTVESRKNEAVQYSKKITTIKKRLSGPVDGIHLELFKEEIQKIRNQIKECVYQNAMIVEVEKILKNYAYEVEEVVINNRYDGMMSHVVWRPLNV